MLFFKPFCPFQQYLRAGLFFHQNPGLASLSKSFNERLQTNFISIIHYFCCKTETKQLSFYNLNKKSGP